MSHYSNNPALCRIDIFKSSGKWYATGSIDMSARYSGSSTHDAVFDACVVSKAKSEGWPLETTAADVLENGYTIVCLEPYHEHSHPVMLKKARL